MTRRGRSHPELLRFQNALAATGGRILVPEVREWTELRFAPERAQEILRASLAWMNAESATAPGGAMLVGLSFGAPQAILAASDSHLTSDIRGVLAWGGYSDLGRIFRFALTGEHGWDGESYRQEADPYARWVIGANCLPLALGLEGEKVGAALHTLAAAAGDSQTPGSHPRHDPLKRQLREELSVGSRTLFDLFVPPAGTTANRLECFRLVEEVLPAIRQASPLLDPLPRIERIDVPVRILHGRADLLIPFTEALHMGRALAPLSVDTTVRVTGLFSHSGEDRSGGGLARARESVRLLEGMRGVFGIG
jgi:pimeloyl-ACP methyl ester carboxylesterase